MRGDIQSRCRFIRDKNVRVTSQRHRDHRALAHTAGKLESITVHHGFRLSNFNLAQQLNGFCACCFLVHLAMQSDGFNDLRTNGVNRGQGAHRLLENQTDAPTTNGANFAAIGFEFANVRITKRDGAAGNARLLVNKPQQGTGGHTFARAAFANQT